MGFTIYSIFKLLKENNLLKTTQTAFYCLIIWLTSLICYSQDVSLYEQFNGRYDFTVVGNTLNPLENNPNSFCYILESSAASLNLQAGDQIEKAFLYWAGSGTGDFQVKLNGITINSERDFPIFRNNLNYVSA